MSKLHLQVYIALFMYIVLCFPASAVDPKIIGTQELPLELNLILDYLQSPQGEHIELKSEALDSIYHIDTYARVLNKEDIFLIAKIEIYKSLLKINSSFPRATIDGETLKILKQSIKTSREPFVTWFLKALLKDTENLLESTLFKEYLLQKNNGRLEQTNLKKIDKKVQIIYRWVSKINLSSSDAMGGLKAELGPLMLESLKNIEESFFILAKNTEFGDLPPLVTKMSDLKFFEVKKEVKKALKEARKEKSIDDILEPITAPEKGTPTLELPEPSNEDWIKEESTPSNLKNLPKPSDDADWLQDF